MPTENGDHRSKKKPTDFHADLFRLICAGLRWLARAGQGANFAWIAIHQFILSFFESDLITNRKAKTHKKNWKTVPTRCLEKMMKLVIDLDGSSVNIKKNLFSFSFQWILSSDS